jgi:hypothetical protein
MFEVAGNGNQFTLSSVDAGYRINSWPGFSIGYAHLQSFEIQGLDEEKITVTDDLSNDHTDVTRYFRFSGDGIKLAAKACLAPSARLSLDSQVSAVWEQSIRSRPGDKGKLWQEAGREYHRSAEANEVLYIPAETGAVRRKAGLFRLYWQTSTCTMYWTCGLKKWSNPECGGKRIYFVTPMTFLGCSNTKTMPGSSIRHCRNGWQNSTWRQPRTKRGMGITLSCIEQAKRS